MTLVGCIRGSRSRMRPPRSGDGQREAQTAGGGSDHRFDLYRFNLEWALHKKSGTATQLDLKSAIANRQVRNKDVQYPQQLLWLIAHGC